MSDTLVLLGTIGAPHGVKGEVRIKAFTGDPMAIANYGPLSDEKGRRFEIAELRPAKEVVIARLKGVTSREAAETLTGLKLFVPREKLPDPEDEDEFLQADLVGCAVVGPDAVVLGTIAAVVNFGAGDLLDVATTDGRSVLLPFTKAFVPKVDIPARRVDAVPPEGLFEIDDAK
jgi:16S rRNA processing protein RimM